MKEQIYCGEILSDSDGFTAACTIAYGVEHSHHDRTAREAVASGLAEAEELCEDCGAPIDILGPYPMSWDIFNQMLCRDCGIDRLN